MFLTGLDFGLGNDDYVTIRSDTLVSPDLATVSVTDYYSEGRRAFSNYRDAMLADESLTPSELANELAKRRARHLLKRVDDLFFEGAPLISLVY